MTTREPLASGQTVTMPNGSVYTVGGVIGEGGFSLLYSVTTKGGASEAVLKEYYPADGARRDGTAVRPAPGCEEAFARGLQSFRSESALGGAARRESFQIVPFALCDPERGLAVLPRWSRDMASFLDVAKRWEEDAPPSSDPCFSDLGRVRQALCMAESALCAVSAVHRLGMLHLDLSARNVVWAGTQGGGSAAFLTDFGCALDLASASPLAPALLSYSPGFAAPELRRPGSPLTPAADVYSAGVLLFLLCAGKRATSNWRLGDLTGFRGRAVRRETETLRIPLRLREELGALILKACAADPGERYQSADEMGEAISALLLHIPRRPVNEDPTKAFTLASLCSMLTGSESPQDSWAQELADRRGAAVPIPEDACLPLTRRTFAGGEELLRALLPDAVFRQLEERARLEPAFPLSGVLSGRCPEEWKRSIVSAFLGDGGSRFRELCVRCEALLDAEGLFLADAELLFSLLGGEGELLHRCCRRCDMRGAPYLGLALFALSALLGEKGFSRLFPDERAACRWMRPYR